MDQQLGRLATGNREQLAVSPDLDRAQHRELQHRPSLSACQRRVSAARDRRGMHEFFCRLLLRDDAAIAAIVEASRTSDDPTILVAAALFAPHGDRLLARAERLASTTRDRQLVAIASAYQRGETELVDALARDHLVDHPDNVLVAWIADASNRQTTNQEER